MPLVEYEFSSEKSLAEISAGAIGQGTLVYYTFANQRREPRIAVLLNREGFQEPAVARVFVPPDSHTGGIFLIEQDGLVTAREDSVLALELVAEDGWWVRDGITNYNLDVTVYGQVAAMWGATPNFGSVQPANWPSLLGPGEMNAKIVVRDTNRDGFPDWDWRTMLPEFPSRGDLRTNYSERKCRTLVSSDPGVSPEWPYVALEGGFEQERDTLRPPIVLDWVTGQLKYFSELVTVRNQNCSYSLYSISRVTPGDLNHPNFETPFAFYDLSGAGIGYPNLLLRTQRTNEDDKTLFLTNNPETQSIRYSWRNVVGDGRWDYKIEVLGQHRYDAQTPIAGGAAYIDAPDYDAFPSWVVERDWPAVVFIGTEEGGSYRSSEGIYEWSPLSLSSDYYFGWEDEPALDQFQDIRIGLRGEYRLRSVHPPELYLSAIDYRLHLKWAEHGIWRLNDEEIIRVANLDGDETIDTWRREKMAVMVDEAAQTGSLTLSELEEPNLESGEGAAQHEVIEELYALETHLLHQDGSDLTLVAAQYDPVLFETMPPRDRATWERHRTELAPFHNKQRDPANLQSWLDAFPGPRSEVSRASASNVHLTDGGFRFELALLEGFQSTGEDLLGLDGLESGTYLVETAPEGFHIAPLSAVELMVIPAPDSAGNFQTGSSITMPVLLKNTSDADAIEVALVVALGNDEQSAVEVERLQLDLLAGQTLHTFMSIPVQPDGLSNIYYWVENAAGERLTQVQLPIRDRVVNRSLEPLRIVGQAQPIMLAAMFLAFLVLLVLGARLILPDNDIGNAE